MPEPKLIIGPNGKTYTSITAIADAYGIDHKVLKYRLERGMSLEDALTGKTLYSVTAPNGQEYPTFEAMCTAYGIKAPTVRARLRSGDDLETALTTETSTRKKLQGNIIKDHLGNEFKTFGAMCKHYGKSRNLVLGRLKKGLDLKSVLEEPSHKHCCKDHLGNEFASFSDMCSHYNVKLQTVRSRMERKGMSLEQALTGKDMPNICYDHKGVRYPSFNAMCKAYNVDPKEARKRIDAKWPLEEALTTPSKMPDPCDDHLGNTYASFTDMCRAYGKTARTVRRHLEKGQTLEEALTTQSDALISVSNTGVDDQYGNHFPAYRAFLNYYMLGSNHLQGHKKDLSMKDIYQALKNRVTNINGQALKITNVTAPYLEIEINNTAYIIHIEKLLEMYHDSSEFDPLVGLGRAKAKISSIKPAGFPYYDAVINGISKRISYWELMREESKKGA